MTAISLQFHRIYSRSVRTSYYPKIGLPAFPKFHNLATQPDMAIFEKVVVGGRFLEKRSLDPLSVHVLEKPPREGLTLWVYSSELVNIT